MKRIAQSEIQIGRDKYYHSYEYKTTIREVINALSDAKGASK